MSTILRGCLANLGKRHKVSISTPPSSMAEDSETTVSIDLESVSKSETPTKSEVIIVTLFHDIDTTLSLL